MNKNWFELKEIKEKDTLRQVWTPLWQSKTIVHNGRIRENGYCAETIVGRSIAFELEQKGEALSIDWGEVVRDFGNRPHFDEGIYSAADIADFWDTDFNGLNLCLEQQFDCDKTNLYLHQDIILSLELKQIGDSWVRPIEDDVEVAKITRDVDGSVSELLIKTDYLRDYLCAREMGLALFTYHERTENTDANPNFWASHQSSSGDFWRWTGDTSEVIEGFGFGFGDKALLVHVTRENTDYEEDLPDLKDETQENIKSKTFERTYKGEILYNTLGSLWVNKWLPPADNSPISRRDEISSNCMFYADISGKKISGDELRHVEGWLWFKPELISEILKQKRAFLKWHTLYTGSIYFDRATYLHFGINSIGLLNVLSEDVGRLEEFRKESLVSFNVKPEGGVSKELLMAQKDGIPADSEAPENRLGKALRYLEAVCIELLGRSILRDHPEVNKLIIGIHRFQALKQDDIFDVANDLNKLFVERLDKDFLIELSDADKKEGLGSIKLLSRFVDKIGHDGRKFTEKLAGCYELRNGKSHLKSSKIQENFELAGIEDSEKPYLNAMALIENVADTAGFLGNMIKEHFAKDAIE